MSEPSRTHVIKLQDNGTMKFLELYADERSLYDASCKEYKDPDIRKAAVTRISEAMAIPGFGPKEVCAKFINLRSSYCQELKKIADSERSGSGTDGVYVPKVVWFETINSFIHPFVQQRPTKSNLVIGTNLSCAISPEEPTEPENYVDSIHDSISIEVQPNNPVETTPKTSANKRKAPSQPSSNTKVKKTYDPELIACMV
uniref:MADF domain-containing protein n=1 Tax=Clastoptera arizonana TaxID=38151 RepID=A0A1B6DL30_9HEMI